MDAIEIRVADHLEAAELSVGEHVYLVTPERPPEEYILVEKTGSGARNHIDQAMIAVKSVSKNSMANAIRINEKVKEAMEEFAQLPSVFACSLNSDYPFTNTETKEYRYQAVFNIIF